MKSWSLFLLAISTAVYASRKVTIPIDSGLKLANTSKTAVAFNLQCKDESGTNIPLFNLPSQNLAAGASTTVIKSGITNSLCGTGWTDMPMSGTVGMSRCNSMSGNMMFTAAVNLACANNATMCTLQQVVDHRGTAIEIYGAFRSTGAWSRYDGTNWINFPDGNTTSFGVISVYNGSSYGKFADGLNGSGVQINDSMGWVSNVDSTVQNVLCCSLYGAVGQCEVEITSSTGHLSSPHYNGGKAF